MMCGERTGEGRVFLWDLAVSRNPLSGRTKRGRCIDLKSVHRVNNREGQRRGGSASHVELEDEIELGYGEIAVRIEESLQCLE